MIEYGWPLAAPRTLAERIAEMTEAVRYLHGDLLDLAADMGAAEVEVEVEPAPGSDATTSAEDERISAWEAIAAHPFFAPCYATAAPLLLSMLDRLDGLAAQPAPQPPAVVRLPDGWERGHDAKYWVETGLTPYGLTLDEERAPGVLNWLGVNYYRCEPAPQPIDPADVRVGDIYEMRNRCRRTAGGSLGLSVTYYLLDRPDPDADLHAAIEAAWDAADAFDAATFVAAIRAAGYVIESKPQAGDLHA